MDELLKALDYFGVVVFAISGGLTAARKGMDLVGFALIGTVTGIGGGTLRDLLLDKPVYWLTEWEYVLMTVLAAWAVFFFARMPPFLGRPPSGSPGGDPRFAPDESVAFTPRLQVMLNWADAVGLAVFSLIGAQAALASGTSPFIAVVMGMMTASFGGLIRDMLCNEPPMILHREVYASAAAAGATVFVVLHELAAPALLTLTAGFLAALVVRGLGIVYGLHLPAFPKSDHS
ncbi:MAG: trimeric intracellular cation channel family protein [Halothiobacillaceae bacterium]|nr:MAG: trimeric intracellular cation channel family protein [Halothiobacillaceae bacterium]